MGNTVQRILLNITVVFRSPPQIPNQTCHPTLAFAWLVKLRATATEGISSAKCDDSQPIPKNKE